MKKTYINPEMKVVMLQMQQHVLTMSENSGQVSSKPATEWGSREGSFWDDED